MSKGHVFVTILFFTKTVRYHMQRRLLSLSLVLRISLNSWTLMSYIQCEWSAKPQDIQNHLNNPQGGWWPGCRWMMTRLLSRRFPPVSRRTATPGHGAKELGFRKSTIVVLGEWSYWGRGLRSVWHSSAEFMSTNISAWKTIASSQKVGLSKNRTCQNPVNLVVSYDFMSRLSCYISHWKDHNLGAILHFWRSERKENFQQAAKSDMA